MPNMPLKTFYELSGQTNAQSSAEQEFAKLYDKSIPFHHQSNRFIECDIHAVRCGKGIKQMIWAEL